MSTSRPRTPSDLVASPLEGGDRIARATEIAAAPVPGSGARWRRLVSWLRRHERILWWLHSAWALALGIGAMWLGSRSFGFLRVAFVQVFFIWATSLILPSISERRWLSDRAQDWIRLVVNYFNKNFYQQVLFFVLPVYWASVTVGSRNVLFVGLLAVSAVLSTFDLVYDRHLSVRRSLTAVFFAFNLFACANVALPVLWSIGNAHAMRLAALVALVGFATIRVRMSDLRRRPVVAALVASALGLAMTIEWGRSFIPPAPLRLHHSRFGTAFDRATLAVTGPVDVVPAGNTHTLYVLTAIKAPLGLKDRVRHRWSSGGRLLRESPYFTVTGGRREGFRFWTVAEVPELPAGAVIQVDVETEGGQLIGRARLPVGARAP